jgi:hypothetical protein
MNRRIRTVVLSLYVIAAFLILWIAAGTSFGSDGTTSPSLAGLQGLAVMVIPVNPDAEQNGINKDRIQSDIEQKLRNAGIKVLAGRELEKPGFPYLNLDIAVAKDKAPELYRYNIKIEVYKQEIQNPQDEIETAFQWISVKTWSAERTGTAPGSGLKDSIQKQLDDAVLKLIADYQTANPKK